MSRVAVAVLTLALASQARADDRALAADAFERGRKQMKDGDYPAACASFELSLRLERTIGTLYNLGLCHEKVGKLATAWTELKQVSETDTKKERAADAAKHVSDLEPRLTRFKVLVDPVPGLVVERDGVDITAIVGQAVPADPKSYIFTAKAPGKKQVSVEVALSKEGETIEVNLPAFATTDEAPRPVVPTAYPSELALRPLLMPDGRLEATANSTLETSDSQFQKTPLFAGAGARFGIQKFELGLVTNFHVRFPQKMDKPNPWESVGGSLAYAIKPMLAGRLEYDRFHPIGDIGNGSNLRGSLEDKFLIAPRVAFDGRAGFLFQQFTGGGSSVSEFILETHYALQATASPKWSLEAAAELDINLGGQLYTHTVTLGVAPRVLFAASREIDVFAQIFVGLLPAVEGKSSSDFRSYVLGLNWRR